MRNLSETWHGGDGFSWRCRRGDMVWHRLDFLVGLPDAGRSYLLEREPIWRELCLLGYPATNALCFRFARYYSRNRWVPGNIRALLTPQEILRAYECLVPAFAEGILHGDLSPENLVFSPEGNCQWIDWLHAGVEGNSCLRGKRPYLAPERALLGRCTLASEIYACGRLLVYWTYGSPLAKILEPLLRSATHPLVGYRPRSLPEFLRELSALLGVSPGV